MLGTRIGHFRIVSVIGRGGMGEVYSGFDEVLERNVALKAIRAEHRLDPLSKARFLREARVLSQLAHPNICQIYDFIEGNEADFLVLELISGRSLAHELRTTLDDAKKLRIAEQIADVLIAAHEKGVIHRDLKPENVMLTSDGNVKVLDFGLSRGVTDEPLPVVTSSAETGNANPSPADFDEQQTVDRPLAPLPTGSHSASTLTTAGTIMGTLGYMSPEQARGEAATPASDVFSFGLLLQELFSGGHSFAREGTLDERLERARRADTQAFVARDPDLTSLIDRMKSLAPEVRPTALDARDRLRWIAEKPARKRRRFLATAALVTLSIFSIGATTEAVLIAKARNRANQAAARAEKTLDFLAGTFRVANPRWGKGPGATAGEVIDHAAATLDTTKDDPLLSASLMLQLAVIYDEMGRYDSAEPLARESLAIRERVLGPAEPGAASSLAILGTILRNRGKYRDAEKLLARALAIRERAFGPDDLATAESLEDLGLTLIPQQKYDEAHRLIQRAHDIYQRRVPADDPRIANVAINLANVLTEQGRYAEAEALLIRAAAIQEKSFGPDHLQVALTVGNLANLYTHENLDAKAEPLARRALAMYEKALGPDHVEVARSRGIVAMICTNLKKYDEAEALFRLNHETFGRVFGPGHPRTYQPLYNIACGLALRGRGKEALAQLRRVVEIVPDAGYLAGLATDDDLASLRGDPEFQAMVATVKARRRDGERREAPLPAP